MPGFLKLINETKPQLCWPTLCLALVILAFASCTRRPQQQTQLISEGWVLVNPLTQEHLRAEVPGSVHTDLLHAGRIPDPFVGKVEDSLQWIGQQEWEYIIDFVPDQEIVGFDHIQLVFEGLDTYAKVWLNDTLIIQADNMFRSWKADVGKLLKPDTNSIRLRCYPPGPVNAQKANKLAWRIPEERAFSRKAPFQFGWDWGPTYITMGIWKPVKLEAWRTARIEDVRIQQLAVSAKSANLQLNFELQSDRKQAVNIVLHAGGKLLINQTITSDSGLQSICLPFQLDQPDLWWPNGLGKQLMTDFEFEASCAGQSLAKQTIRTGLRSIELVQEPDSIGTAFFFRVNGKATFMKGANVIPGDHFMHRLSRESQRKMLISAQQSHMNMLRVWGGGIYPNEDFFELCDSLGLLVWQDFMFAGTMYPSDKAFLENVKAEATEQIRRISRHCSLALWCGNNEIDEAFHNWGWQRSLGWTAQDSVAIWDGYTTLFHRLLPELVRQHDGQRPYWPSSPSIGWGRSESLTKGDAHYWGVWWGEQPFSVFDQKVGRFMSEYGFQAMPELSSIEKYISELGRKLGSSELEAHQKHPRGTKLIQHYMEQDYSTPDSLSDYVYVSQLLQASGIGRAIEAHRRGMPRCMGTLYWQLNDSWPVTSWSSIDYYGRWKALQFRLKTLYAPVLLSADQANNCWRIWMVSDSSTAFKANIRFTLIDFDGNVLRHWESKAEAEPLASRIVSVFRTDTLISGFDPQRCCLLVEASSDERPVSARIFWFTSPKNILLPEPGIQIQTEAANHQVELSISSQCVAKDVYLICNDKDGVFSNNFFDLQPKQPLKVSFSPSGNLTPEQLIFEVKSLYKVNSRKEYTFGEQW